MNGHQQQARTNELEDGAEGSQEGRPAGAQDAAAGGVEQLPLAVYLGSSKGRLVRVLALQGLH